MISRIWHGWTTVENADPYELLLHTEIFVNIKQRQITGFKGIQLLRRKLESEVEFITVMWFESIESIKDFAGEDYKIAVAPPRARMLLSRFDEHSEHYEVKSMVGSIFSDPTSEALNN
ncbi:MAG: antibiotic biosynthesis monooxygenase [Candidatus Heimdallarchaeota archaeon]|nr:antibiotic biosynthesis monooxygenase [Candidatus Heimdallarchaeota archaeon]